MLIFMPHVITPSPMVTQPTWLR